MRPEDLDSKNISGIVFAYAEWCKPSMLMLPIIESLSKLNHKPIYLNTDKHAEAAKKLKVRGTPTLLIVQDGKVLKKLTGAHNLKDCLNLCSS